MDDITLRKVICTSLSSKIVAEMFAGKWDEQDAEQDAQQDAERIDEQDAETSKPVPVLFFFDDDERLIAAGHKVEYLTETCMSVDGHPKYSNCVGSIARLNGRPDDRRLFSVLFDAARPDASQTCLSIDDLFTRGVHVDSVQGVCTAIMAQPVKRSWLHFLRTEIMTASASSDRLVAIFGAYVKSNNSLPFLATIVDEPEEVLENAFQKGVLRWYAEYGFPYKFLRMMFWDIFHNHRSHAYNDFDISHVDEYSPQ